MPNGRHLRYGFLGLGLGLLVSFAVAPFLQRVPEMDATRMGTLLFLNPESEFTYVAISCIEGHSGRSIGENARLAVPYRIERRRELGLYIERSDPDYVSPGIETVPNEIPEMLTAMRQIQFELREQFGCISDVLGRPIE